MFHENLVMRNLGVLERLLKSGASLEELAQSAKCRNGDLSSSLKILQEQGLVCQTNGKYQLADKKSTSSILAIANPWISYFNGAFYDIAKDAAKIILEKSWEKKEIADVLLYGSTLTNPNPEDIDLLIIHKGGHKMKCFCPYSALRVDEPIGEENARDSAWSIFRQLGYRYEEVKRDTVSVSIGERISGLNAGTISEEKIREEDERLKSIYGEDYSKELNISDRLDIYGIDNVFDVNVLHSGVLLEGDKKEAEISGVRTGRIIFQTYSIREKAIKSCKDPTFWYTILSEGRLYDRTKHDFTLKIEDKYPKALELFPSK